MDKQMVIIGGAIDAGVVVILVVVLVLISIKRHKQQHTSMPSTTISLAAAEGESSSIILKSIDDGVLLIDAQGTIQVFNPGASKITGWQSDEAIGLHYDNVIKLTDDKNTAYGEQQNPFGRALHELATIRDSGATLTSRSNRHVPLSLTVSPLIAEDQTIYGAVAVFRDVSKERQQEKQRAEFISTASHEMRTPIAAIEGYLSLVINSPQTEIDTKSKEYLTKAYNSTKHLGKLFQDLLNSSQAEDGRIISNPSLINVGSFIRNLLQDLHFSAEKKGLAVEFVMGSDVIGNDNRREARANSEKVVAPLYYVYADPDRLREVISNLFDNAVKYSSHGTISLGLAGNDETVQVFVKDTGIGIAPEDLPHLFQKFYRIDNSDTRTIGGTGLGLYLARTIIEHADGKIWATSEPGKGSTFFINLPRLSGKQAAALTQGESKDLIAPNVIQ